MQTLTLLKTSTVDNVDRKQTLLVLPATYIQQFSPNHGVTFQEIAQNALMVQMVGPHEQAFNKVYRLVTHHGSGWVSVPRRWLRNVGAREGDRLDVYSTIDPKILVVKHRPAPVQRF